MLIIFISDELQAEVFHSRFAIDVFIIFMTFGFLARWRSASIICDSHSFTKFRSRRLAASVSPLKYSVKDAADPTAVLYFLQIANTRERCER